MDRILRSRGLGDTIAKFTKAFGINPCGGCEGRQETLNRLIPYGKRKQYEHQRNELASTQVKSTSRVAVKPVHISTLPQSKSTVELNALPTGFVRDPLPLVQDVAKFNFLDIESFQNEALTHFPKLPRDHFGRMVKPYSVSNSERFERRQRPIKSRVERFVEKYSPATQGKCGVDVTDQIKKAIRMTKLRFGGWSDNQKSSACETLIKFSTGGGAWDIVELYNQVRSDVLNTFARLKGGCAALGANPSCASSVTIDNTCHFAGSANYVIFGVMCKLCHSYYSKKPTSITTLTMAHHFTIGEMNWMIDIYKKWYPFFASSGGTARNIGPAKDWAKAGYLGWPVVPTPTPDRANCLTTCPYWSPLQEFSVRW